MSAEAEPLRRKSWYVVVLHGPSVEGLTSGFNADDDRSAIHYAEQQWAAGTWPSSACGYSLRKLRGDTVIHRQSR